MVESADRLEEWAQREGTRRNIAQRLAAEATKYDRRGKAHERWAFVWEVSGDRKELRKLLERIVPHWRLHGIRVIDPTLPGVERGANVTY